MTTKLRKEINQELADKLLLKDASNWAIIRQLHRSMVVTTVEILALGLAVGIIIGVNL